METVIASPELGVSLTPTSLRVNVNPNPVEISVASRGPGGLVLHIEALGLTIGVALTSKAAQHLAGLLAPQEAA